MKECLFCGNDISDNHDLCKQCRRELDLIFQAVHLDSDVQDSWTNMVRIMKRNGWFDTEEPNETRRAVEREEIDYEITRKNRPLRDPTGRILKGNPYSRPFGL